MSDLAISQFCNVAGGVVPVGFAPVVGQCMGAEKTASDVGTATKYPLGMSKAQAGALFWQVKKVKISGDYDVDDAGGNQTHTFDSSDTVADAAIERQKLGSVTRYSFGGSTTPGGAYPADSYSAFMMDTSFTSKVYRVGTTYYPLIDVSFSSIGNFNTNPASPGSLLKLTNGIALDATSHPLGLFPSVLSFDIYFNESGGSNTHNSSSFTIEIEEWLE